MLSLWNRGRKDMVHRNEDMDNPLLSLQRDVNRMFDEFWNRWERPFDASGTFLTTGGPRTDVSESDEEIEISVELPGLDEKDVEVNITQDVLTIRGEKKTEREEKKKDYVLSERSYGSFHRSIPLPVGVDPDRAEARFERGVLTIHLPKTPEAMERVKRIEITGS